MWNTQNRFNAFLCGVLLVGASHLQEARAEISPKGIYQQTLRATALVITVEGTTVKRGTGWLVDDSRRLMITNRHVVGNSESVVVLFPLYKDGKVVAEAKSYGEDRRPILGRVIDTDPQRDLALIELKGIGPECRKLKLAADSPGPSDRVHSVGNPGASRALWGYTSGTVRQVYKNKYTTGEGEKFDARVVETQAPLNPGDSGGPVVNDNGELVAVTCSGIITAQLVSYCIDVSEVKKFLSEALPLLEEPRTAQEFFDRGKHHFRRGNYDRALGAYTKGIRLEPKNAMAYVDRGIAYGKEGAWDKTIADCTQAIELEAKNARAYRERGYAFVHKRLYDKAIADYNEAIRLDPKDSAAFNRRGWAFFRKGDNDKAAADYSEAIRLQPRFARAYANQAAVFNKKGENAKAIFVCTIAIRLDPDLAPAYQERAAAYIRKRDYAQAIADCNQAIFQEPKMVSAYVSRAYCLVQTANPDLAIVDLSEAIRLNPRNSRAYKDRGIAFAIKGDWDKAIADCTQAIRLGCKDALTYNIRGNGLAAMEEYDKAIADYTEAIRLNSQYIPSYISRARGWACKGDTAKAKADYSEAMRLDPKEAGACNALGWDLATCSEAELRDGKKAVEFASKACKLSRWKSPLILETLAAAHAECGQFEQAISWEKKALELAPDEYKARCRSRLELYQENKPFRAGVADEALIAHGYSVVSVNHQ